MLYSDASGVEHTDSGSHNSGNKSSGRMNRHSFQTTGRVFVWRTPEEAFAPECIVPTFKHGDGSLWYGGVISWRGSWATCYSAWQVKAAHYVNILDQVHPFVQTCPLYQDDNAYPHC
ncbi:transposable element Tcb1 transposase [Trichonephila clavipes]|nr:transposable element Tcb1 transposase [Trichonephila clavipes]